METWEFVKGYEGEYQVSNLGSIRSVNRSFVRSDGKMQSVYGKVLKPSITAGYYRVSLSKQGVKKSVLVHREVARSFLKNPYDKRQVNHKNGNKLDNSVENLEWVTAKENMMHADKNGMRESVKGENNHASKLRKDEVLQIRNKYIYGVNTKDLSEEYGVHPDTIRLVASGKTWKHL